MVNGVSMESVSSTFAIQILKTCTKMANIVSGAGWKGQPGLGAPVFLAEPHWPCSAGVV